MAADTIFALSSGSVPSGLAVIRISGAGVSKAISAVCRTRLQPRLAHLLTFRHPETGERLDEGLALYFEGPASFTGEDVLELHGHGGVASISALLDALVTLPGFRPAEAGEFSRPKKRYNRFAVVLLANQTYNFTFSSEPPRDMRFQIQKSDKDRHYAEEWTIIKIYYPIKNSVRIRNRGATVDPIILRGINVTRDLTSKACGANQFYYNDQTIEFVTNGHRTCFPRVTLTNSVYLHAKFNMDLKTFYEMDGVTKFIDRVCTLLNIQDYSRVKIVGIYEGSVVVDSFIEGEDIISDNGTNSTNATNETGDTIETEALSVEEMKERLA